MNYLVTSEARLKLNNNLNERKSIIVCSRVYMLTEFFQRFFMNFINTEKVATFILNFS